MGDCGPCAGTDGRGLRWALPGDGAPVDSAGVGTQLLMILYLIRSEDQLMEQIDFNILYRWFAGMEAARAGARGLAVPTGGRGTQPAAHRKAHPDSGKGLSGETCLCSAPKGAPQRSTRATTTATAHENRTGNKNSARISEFFSKLFSRAASGQSRLKGTGFSPYIKIHPKLETTKADPNGSAFLFFLL